MERGRVAKFRVRRARRRSRTAIAVLLAAMTATGSAIVAAGPAGVSQAFPNPGTNERVSIPPAGMEQTADHPAMSHDGRYVAYLVNQDPSAEFSPERVFVTDRRLHRTDLVPILEPRGFEGFTSVRISDEGRYLAVEENVLGNTSVLEVDRGTPDATGVFPAVLATQPQRFPTPPTCLPNTTPNPADGVQVLSTEDFTITGATWAAGTVTLTVANPSGIPLFPNGSAISVSGITPAGYNTPVTTPPTFFTVIAVNQVAGTISYLHPGALGAATVTGAFVSGQRPIELDLGRPAKAGTTPDFTVSFSDSGGVNHSVTGTATFDTTNQIAAFTPSTSWDVGQFSANGMTYSPYTAIVSAKDPNGKTFTMSWAFSLAQPMLFAPRVPVAPSPRRTASAILSPTDMSLLGASAAGSQVLVTGLDNPFAPQCLVVWDARAHTTFDPLRLTSAATLDKNGPAAAISADGRHVGFVATVTVPSGELSIQVNELFLYNRDVAGTGSLDVPGNRSLTALTESPAPISTGNFGGLALSRDASVVAYAAKDARTISQLFVLDFNPPPPPAAQRFAPAPLPVQITNGDGDSFAPSLSLGGRYVSFVSAATDLIAGLDLAARGFCSETDDTQQCNVYEADWIGVGGRPQIELVSDGESNGTQARSGAPVTPPTPDADSGNGSGNGSTPVVSGDGRLVAFDSSAANLLSNGPECDVPPCDPAALDHDPDVFVHTTLPGLVGAPNPLDLGSAKIGKQTPPRVATFTHTGFGALTATSVDITGTDKDEFVVTAQTCVVPGTTLNANDTCGVSVVFKPKRSGPANALLEVHHNGAGGVSTVRLVGGGVTLLSVFTLTPDTLDFGTQILTVPTATPKAVTITNTGETPLVITAPGQVGDFAITNACPGAGLAAGKSCTINVVFRPTNVGTRNTVLTIVATPTNGAPPQPAMITLLGNAPLPSVSLSPGIGHPREVVQALGQNWPPGTTVVLTWSDGPGIASSAVSVPASKTTPNVNQFAPSDTVLVFPRAQVGTHLLIAVDPTSGVNMTNPSAPYTPLVAGSPPLLNVPGPGVAVALPLPFLVQSPTVNGTLDFVVRNG